MRGFDQHVAIGTQNGLVAVLTLDPQELMEIGRSRVSRSLTEQECETYLHGTCPGDGAENREEGLSDSSVR